MFIMRRNKVLVVVSLLVGFCFYHGWKTMEVTHTGRKSGILPAAHAVDPGESGTNQLELDQTSKVKPMLPNYEKWIQHKPQHNRSMVPYASLQGGTRNGAFGQTYYKWNDVKRGGWKTLPLKKPLNGSFVPGLTREEAREAVIYTRVPKTGSRFMLDLIRATASMNKFYMIYSTVYNHSSVYRDRARFARAVGRIRPPFLLARQLYFLDFTEFEMAQPSYISLIRDPVNRVVSSFNFNRFGDGTRNKWHKMFRADRNLTLDECIMNDETECSVDGASVTIRYFCGQDPRCNRPNDWSLERAMENVKRYYLVVGLTEDYESTLKVLEERLPDFFRGVAGLYKPAESNIKTASKKKYKPSPEAEKVLKERFHLEYKFYNFIKDRLDDLKKKLEI